MKAVKLKPKDKEKIVSILEIKKKFAQFTYLVSVEARNTRIENSKIMEHGNIFAQRCLEINSSYMFLIDILRMFSTNTKLLDLYRESIVSISDSLDEDKERLNYRFINELSTQVAASMIQNETLLALHELVDRKTEQIKGKKKGLQFLKRKIETEASKIASILEFLDFIQKSKNAFYRSLKKARTLASESLINIYDDEPLASGVDDTIISAITEIIMKDILIKVRIAAQKTAAVIERTNNELTTVAASPTKGIIDSVFEAIDTTREIVDRVISEQTAILDETKLRLYKLHDLILLIKDIIPKAKQAVSSISEITLQWVKLEEGDGITSNDIDDFLSIAVTAKKNIGYLLEKLLSILQFDRILQPPVGYVAKSIKQSQNKLSSVISKAHNKKSQIEVQKIYSDISLMPPKIEDLLSIRDLPFEDCMILSASISRKIESIGSSILYIRKMEESSLITDDAVEFIRRHLAILYDEKYKLSRILQLASEKIGYINTKRDEYSILVDEIDDEFNEIQKTVYSSGTLNDIDALIILHNKLELLEDKIEPLTDIDTNLLSSDNIDRVVGLRQNIHKITNTCKKRIEELEYDRADSPQKDAMFATTLLTIKLKKEQELQSILNALSLTTRNPRTLAFIKLIIEEGTRVIKSIDDNILSELGKLGFMRDTVGGNEYVHIVLLDPSSDSRILAKFSFHKEHSRTKGSTRMLNVRNLIAFLTNDCGLTTEVLDDAILETSQRRAVSSLYSPTSDDKDAPEPIGERRSPCSVANNHI